ncbi:MAG TPA: metal-dependent hydrolase [Desulfobacteraceae bacterium]|nr:metal-dependent hydrolase [Desulfobacteraceae bacterium]|tara:strand:- start:804 stop:1481 length:678 start_codon:yes stop_codon:yes gene_type:complete
MKLRYFSHSAFQMVTDQGHRILIDPFLTDNPTSPVSADEVEADFILLTHGHGDHFGDTLSIAERCNALCICENELASYIGDKGLRAHNMHIGGGFDFEFGRVKLTQALHSSSTPDNQCHGSATGLLITIGDQTIYHTGDTGLFSDLKLIGDMNDVDIMMVPIGDNFTMGIDDAVTACEFVNPDLAIPIHYNTFPVIQADPLVFKKKLTAKGIGCKVLEFGQEIEI